MYKTERYLSVVSPVFYANFDTGSNILFQSCLRRHLGVSVFGVGERMNNYQYRMHRLRRYLESLDKEYVIVADWTDTMCVGKPDFILDVLRERRLVLSTDYQEVPYLCLTNERPIHPFTIPILRETFIDPETGKVYAPNGGLFGGKRTEVIKYLNACEGAYAYANNDKFDVLLRQTNKQKLERWYDEMIAAGQTNPDDQALMAAVIAADYPAFIDKENLIFEDVQKPGTKAHFVHLSGTGQRSPLWKPLENIALQYNG